MFCPDYYDKGFLQTFCLQLTKDARYYNPAFPPTFRENKC